MPYMPLECAFDMLSGAIEHARKMAEFSRTGGEAVWRALRPVIESQLDTAKEQMADVDAEFENRKQDIEAWRAMRPK